MRERRPKHQCLHSENLMNCIRVPSGFPKLCTHTHRDRVCIPDRAAPILWEDFSGNQPGMPPCVQLPGPHFLLPSPAIPEPLAHSSRKPSHLAAAPKLFPGRLHSRSPVSLWSGPEQGPELLWVPGRRGLFFSLHSPSQASACPEHLFAWILPQDPATKACGSECTGNAS